MRQAQQGGHCGPVHIKVTDGQIDLTTPVLNVGGPRRMTTTAVEPIRDDRAAIDKAFSLLSALGEYGSWGLGVSELARRAQLSKSTAFRVLGMLERNAMVERVGTKYRLGARLHELGKSVYAPGQDRIRDLLLPFLADLYEMTRHTVHLASLHGTDVVYLAKLYGHRTVAAPSRIGARLPAHCTAVGKVLLAYDPAAATEALSTPLHRLTHHSICDADELAAELVRVRRDGVAVDHEESQPGLACVAAPVMGRYGRPLAAMSVCAPAGIDMQPLTTSLRRVCASASQAMSRSGLARSA
jgi:IclR family transcriptional regulator, KDG regulon repressor